MYGVINLESGELIMDNVEKKIKNNKITKAVIDDMLSKANRIEDIDENMLKAWLYVIGEINCRNKDQYRVYGESVNEDLIFDTATKSNMLVYVARIIRISHKWSNRLMITQKTGVSSWKQLWDEIDCNNRNTQAKVRKFLNDYNLVRTIEINRKGIKETEFYLNPFLYRSRTFVNSTAIKVFKDFAKESENINSYTYTYLKKIDVL